MRPPELMQLSNGLNPRGSQRGRVYAHAGRSRGMRSGISGPQARDAWLPWQPSFSPPDPCLALYSEAEIRDSVWGRCSGQVLLPEPGRELSYSILLQ